MNECQRRVPQGFIAAFVDLVKQTFFAWQDHNVSRLAASLSFYTTFSLAPVLLIALAIAGAIVGNDLARGELAKALAQYIGADGTGFVLTVLDQASGRMGGRSVTVVGLAISIFGATVAFAELQSALNEIWNVRPKKGFNLKRVVMSRLLSFAVVLVIGILLFLSVVFSAMVTAINSFFSNSMAISAWFLSMSNFGVSFFLITLMFAMIFRILPDAEIAWRDVALGAIFTSLLFAIGKHLIAIYIAHSSIQSLYGAAGSFVVLLAWMYYSAQVFFLGSEICQVWSTRYGTGIRPSPFAEFDSDNNPQP